MARIVREQVIDKLALGLGAKGLAPVFREQANRDFPAGRGVGPAPGCTGEPIGLADHLLPQADGQRPVSTANQLVLGYPAAQLVSVPETEPLRSACSMKRLEIRFQ